MKLQQSKHGVSCLVGERDWGMSPGSEQAPLQQGQARGPAPTWVGTDGVGATPCGCPRSATCNSPNPNLFHGGMGSVRMRIAHRQPRGAGTGACPYMGWYGGGGGVGRARAGTGACPYMGWYGWCRGNPLWLPLFRNMQFPKSKPVPWRDGFGANADRAPATTASCRCGVGV